MGGTRVRALLTAAVAAGLLTRVSIDGREAYRIVEDPEFLHIRDKEGVLWERQRDRDRRNPELTSAVRLRDGDSCRYCGVVVSFLDRKGGRGGTYDHYEPGQPASLDTYVVACRSHNSSMRDGDRMPLLDAPAMPYYTHKTLIFLDANGRKPAVGTYRTDPAREDDPVLTPGGHRRDTARPAPAVDTAPQRDQDTAGPAATLTPQQPATHEPAPAKRSPEPSVSWVHLEGHVADEGSGSDLSAGLDPPGGARTGRDGTGRAGSGRAGPGRVGAGAPEPQRGRRGRGRRRGRRGAGDCGDWDLAQAAVDLGVTPVELQGSSDVRDQVRVHAGLGELPVMPGQWRLVVPKVRDAHEAAARSHGGSRCRACAAPIVWGETELGKAMPVDPLPRPDGNVIRIAQGRRLVLRVLGPGSKAGLGRPAYFSHYVTCPFADQLRKTRAKRARAGEGPAARCRVCSKRMDPWLPEQGYSTHPDCDPDDHGNEGKGS